MPTKIVINRKYGGFGLSEQAYRELGLDWDFFGYGGELRYRDHANRTDPKLVAAVEKLLLQNEMLRNYILDKRKPDA